MRVFVLLASVLFISCTSMSSVSEPIASGQPQVLESGLDLANFDQTVRPQDDLYRFVNGKWLDTFEIPEDKSNYGHFTKLYDEAQQNLKAIILDSVDAKGETSTESVQIGDAYKAFMNVEKIESLKLSPLNQELSQIASLSSHQAVVQQMGRLTRLGVASPVHVWVSPDAKKTTEYIVYLTQSGLGLPDRGYYLKEDDKFKSIRKKYIAYLESILKLASHSNPKEAANDILAIETQLATNQWTRVQNRDRDKTYNHRVPVDLQKACESCFWSSFFSGVGLKEVPSVIIRQPSYFVALGKLLSETSVQGWKDYLTVHLISAYAPRLSKDFVDAHFEFYEKTLRGIPVLRPRWKRGVSEVESMLGEAIGQIYVKRHFKPEAKERMVVLVKNLILAFEDGINSLEWMTDVTKVQAREKLSKFGKKIGYPDKWKDYSGLKIDKEDAVGNILRAREFEISRDLQKLGGPIDRNEWFMYPQTVNAYYNPSMNEIVFPAAILQPPFFNLAADDAVNYGAIGAVIGHELSHGFDDQGRKSDGDGILRDWWTTEDATEFKVRADKMVKQYASFKPFDDVAVNGELTLGENIGDLGGLTIAYRAYLLSLNGKQVSVIDGFTGPQRFFLGWSQVWARKYRESELRRRLMTDPHAPSAYRVVGIISNMPEFYAAFGLKEGDKLFRPEAVRVKIW